MEKKDIVKIVLQDKDIAKFVKENKISDNEIINNFAKLSLYQENKKICEGCDGSVCNSSAYGLRSYLEIDNSGRLRICYENCPLAKVEDEYGLEIMDYTDQDITIETNKPRLELLKRLNKFSEEYKNNKFAKGLYLHGPYGIGKSLIILNYAKTLKQNGAHVLFAYYPDLVRRIQGLFGTNKLEELILKLKKVDILILDDIGREANTPYIRDEILGPILQYRCDNDLPMFMTSNRDFKLLESHLSDTAQATDTIKAKAIMARIKYLMDEYELIDKDYRN